MKTIEGAMKRIRKSGVLLVAVVMVVFFGPVMAVQPHSVGPHSAASKKQQDVVFSQLNDEIDLYSMQTQTGTDTDHEAAKKEINARRGINKWFAWIKNTPIMLIMVGMVTIAGCCMCSQWFVSFSKQSNLKLNRYYKRKRKENRRMLTDLVERQVRNDLNPSDNEQL